MTNLAAPPALPHSHEAEQSVLGALMYDNAVIERLPEHLRPEHFFEPFHVALFEAIRTTIASGGIADPTMLVGAVRDHPAFEQFGGLRYLADLLDKSPPANTARDHAALVYDLALRRDLIRVADQIALDARDTTIPAAGHIATAEATLFAIAEAGSVEKSVATFGEALRGAMQQAEAAYLKRRFRRADGRAFTIAAACHDSGGHHTEAVYRFSIDRLARQIWAIKGASDRPGQRSPIWPAKRPTAKNKEKFRPYIIGTQAAKDLVSSQLQVETPGPGYMHYPHDRDIGWFHQITAERIGVKVIGGRKIRFWEPIPGRANEGLDCRVYAYAALAGWMAKGGKLNALVAQIANLPPPEPQPVTDEDDDGSASSAAAPERRRRAAPQRRVVKSSYMTRG